MRNMTYEKSQTNLEQTPTLQAPSDSLENDWRISEDLLLIIFLFLRRTDLSNLSFVSKFTNAFLSRIKHYSEEQFALYNCCDQLNTNRAKVHPLPDANTLTLEKLREHWSGDGKTFKQLCNVRNLKFLYTPQTASSVNFAYELSQLTLSAITQNKSVLISNTVLQVLEKKPDFLNNLYVKDLVILAFIIEAYHRNNDFVFDKKNDKEIKISSLIEHLLGKITSETLLTSFCDPAKICLHLVVFSTLQLEMDYSLEKLFLEFLLKFSPQSTLNTLREVQIIETHYNRPFLSSKSIDIFKPILIPLFINPDLILEVLPKIIVKNDAKKISFSTLILQKICLLPESYRARSLILPDELIFILADKFDCLTFFKNLDKFSDTDQADLYRNAIYYLTKNKSKEFTIDLLDKIFKMPFTELQIKICSTLELTRKSKLSVSAHVILLLLVNPKLSNISSKFLINVFGKHQSKVKLIENFFKLDEAAINCLTNNIPEQSLIDLTFYQLGQFLKFFKSHTTSTLLYSAKNEFFSFISILDLLSMSESQFWLFDNILETIPREQITPQYTQQIFDAVKKLNYSQNVILFKDPKPFLSKITKHSPLSAEVIVKLLLSPLLKLIVTHSIYTTLFNLIGIDKLSYCDEQIQIISGHTFKTFIEGLEKDAPEKYQRVLLIITEACKTNQESQLVRKINEYLNPPPVTKPPAKNSNSPLTANSLFSSTKRQAREEETVGTELEKLNKLLKRAEQDPNLCKIMISAGENYLEKIQHTDIVMENIDEKQGESNYGPR